MSAPGGLETGRITRRFGRLIRIGRDPTMPASDARYVVLTNILAILGAVFTLAFAPVLFASGSAYYPLLQIGYAFVYLPPLWLNHRGHRVAATTWLVLGSHLAVASQVLVEGRGFDVHLFFMLHAILPFMVFAPRHDKLMFALSALAGLDMIAVVALGDRLVPLGPPISRERAEILEIFLLAGLFATLATCAYYARRATLIAEAHLDRAHARSEELLLNILPASIAGRLKATNATIADGFAEVTVLFADIVGFTKMSAHRKPEEVVAMLNELFCKFDDLAGKHQLEKIKTIGDCYMVAGGLPEPRADHAAAVAEMGLEMLRVVRELAAKSNEPLDIRVGMHSGPVVAGVIGKRKFVYDLWGDTVNTASRMESHGLAGRIQVSDETRRLLEGQFRLSSRGEIEVKGKGTMAAWFLDGPLPTTITAT